MTATPTPFHAPDRTAAQPDDAQPSNDVVLIWLPIGQDATADDFAGVGGETTIRHASLEDAVRHALDENRPGQSPWVRAGTLVLDRERLIAVRDGRETPDGRTPG